MKKLISVVLLISMFLCFTACGKKDDTPRAYVSIITDGIKLAAKSVKMVDLDKDGKVSMDDLLKEAHIENSSEKDYASADGGYGTAIAKLWGDESGAYGIYHNNAMPMNLEDEVAAGDYICAYVYQDQVGWSDSYAYFDKAVSADSGSSLSLTLKYSNWSVADVALEGAKITIDGKDSSFVTDAEGKVEISGIAKGEHIISAVHDSVLIVSPICAVTVK